jgi:hypothetical protein
MAFGKFGVADFPVERQNLAEGERHIARQSEKNRTQRSLWLRFGQEIQTLLR